MAISYDFFCETPSLFCSSGVAIGCPRDLLIFCSSQRGGLPSAMPKTVLYMVAYKHNATNTKKAVLSKSTLKF